MIGRRFLVLLLLLLVAGVALAVYTLRIDEVRVEGLRSLPARSIIDASGLEPGDRILWVRLVAAERRIEQIPGIADAVAERSLPGTVVIHVTERVPLARLDPDAPAGAPTKAPQLVVDKEGVVFPATDERVDLVLYGWKGRARPGFRVDARSRAFLAALPDFPTILRTAGRRLVTSPSVVLTVVGGIEIRFGAPFDLDTKARVAAAVLANQRGKKLAYIDVGSPRVPVSREKAPPTPAPTPQPAQPAFTPQPASTPPSPATPVPVAT